MRNNSSLQNLQQQFKVVKVEEDPFYELACAQQDFSLIDQSRYSSEMQKDDAYNHMKQVRGPLKHLIRKNFRY